MSDRGGVRRPERLALGAANGRPKASITSAANPFGTLIATLARPAVASGWMSLPGLSGSTMVSAPGQKASASFSASGLNTA